MTYHSLTHSLNSLTDDNLRTNEIIVKKKKEKHNNSVINVGFIL